MTRRKRSAHPLVACACALAAVSAAPTRAQDEPWANDPAVQQVLEQRRRSIEAMTSTGPTASTERYSPTFVANTPGGGVVKGEQLLALFARGALRYDSVEQKIEYAASHGPDMVVIMGEETVVAGVGPNAGQPVRRRFTDVFRRIDGEWYHDLRHANVAAEQASAPASRP